ncbi:hypothetical protein Patl1_31155 [Pistacia atlantica]|uniref:Uncharacterized protein n=1 Tax=Pistacia atlantica TaxID=434234 RepID=A0ACC1A9E3_9ROSI|nr:hypothetical protein Patl1_31155 [Pistacia atlantica]
MKERIKKKLTIEIEVSEEDKKVFESIAARAIELETEVSRLQHDMITAISEGDEASAESEKVDSEKKVRELERKVGTLKVKELEEKCKRWKVEKKSVEGSLKESESKSKEIEAKISELEKEIDEAKTVISGLKEKTLDGFNGNVRDFKPSVDDGWKKSNLQWLVVVATAYVVVVAVIDVCYAQRR